MSYRDIRELPEEVYDCLLEQLIEEDAAREHPDE